MKILTKYIMNIGGDIVADVKVKTLPSFVDTDYSGVLSVIQSLLNYLFVFSWILMSLVVVVSLILSIVLLFQ